MKKFTKIATVAVMTMVTAGVFAGCGLKGGKDIGKEAALEAALADAGVRESDTTRLRVSSEIDDGRKVYEVRFDVEGTEYDYEISGRDGQILSADTERISTVDTTDRAGTTDTAGTADTAGTTDKEKSGNSQNNAEALGIRRSHWKEFRGHRKTIFAFNQTTMTENINTKAISFMTGKSMSLK